MFEDFQEGQKHVNGVVINFKMGGSGPPLLLLHGYPQSHVLWHKVAPQLADTFTVIASDLRGYGDSSKPISTPDHLAYSKREMGKDQVLLMRQLGFDSFYLAGHDRGGRVAHRMALDFPDAIEKWVVMDIAPTHTMYTTTDMAFAQAYYHWFFLIQPYDVPERMIGADPEYFLRKKFGQWGRDKQAITEAAFAEYLRCFSPEAIHASCEDYRASASIDLLHDEEDLKLSHKIQAPLLCLWGEQGFVGNKYDMLPAWRVWVEQVEGWGLPCGHYLPEEAPDQCVQAILDFL